MNVQLPEWTNEDRLDAVERVVLCSRALVARDGSNRLNALRSALTALAEIEKALARTAGPLTAGGRRK